MSNFSIFNGLRVLKFCKERPVPSDVSIKVLTSTKIILPNNYPYFNRVTALHIFHHGGKFLLTQENPFERLFSSSSTMVN